MREEKLWRFLALLSIATGARACIGSAPRSFSAPTVQFQQAPAPPAAVQVAPQPAQFVPAAGAAARVAAAPVPQGPGVASAGQTSVFEHLLGRSLRLSEFSVDGFNNAGGGPVKEAVALSCNFDGQPCCWANVAQPADQLDWSIATGRPETPAFQNVESPDGSYLIAYARAAAPSDEAQFASCAIGCSSSVIKVRARHWQSENVLLQVCQRESFPTSESNNPLLNCQEFPLQQGIATTEVELPKASVVDIVFVASNFIGQDGDLAIIDDIQVIYEHDPRECPADIEQGQIVQETESPDETTSSILEGGEEDGVENAAVSSSGSSAASAGSSASSGSESSSSHKTETEETEETLIESSHGAKQHGSKISATSSSACLAAKCTFEDGTACSYNDAYTTESITGVNTKFEVVTGQFKNKVTGVKESSEGNFYAATFLHPREMAGLEASTGGLDGDRRLRFQYYEGTYGVLLKACCDSTDTCPFSSDRFVSVGDRTWKYATFLCPKGTDKIIFLCENTRTNQGACAIDDIQVIANSGTADSADEPLC